MKKSKIVGTVISAIVIVVGVFAVVYNAVIVYNADLKYLTYKNIEGTVTAVQSSIVDGKNYYRATYSFIVNGTSYSCSSGYTEEEDKYIAGESATIRYNTKNPSSCYVADESRVWNYLYLGISCIILIIGIKFFDKKTRVK